MARPKKEEKNKNKYYMSFWFNEDQKKIFDRFELKTGEKLRDFILKNITKKNIQITSENDPKYINELNKIGVNLNQISKKINSTGEINNIDIEKINNIIDVLEEKIRIDSIN